MSTGSRAPSSYRGPRWLTGGHAQTVYPYMLARPVVHFRRERIDAPDLDFWDLDWLGSKHSSTAVVSDEPPPPLVVLFHGLEGGSGSHYARSLMVHLASIGWRGVVPHFRGCGGELNRHPRAYHSGDHEEVGAMLAAVHARTQTAAPGTPLFAVGVSLGGSALLNWLGRAGRDAARLVTAAAAVSAPIDLAAAGKSIDRGLNRMYTKHFLATLRPKSFQMARRFPGRLDLAALRRVRTMYDFDDVVTAPLHGFAGADDYWHRASSLPWLRHIAIPTLILNARNDPFIPAASLPGPDDVSPDVLLEQPAQGGHCGFLTGPFPGRFEWLPRRLLQFFSQGK